MANEADYSFEVPDFDDFTTETNDNADQWFEERRCTSMKKRKPVSHDSKKTTSSSSTTTSTSNKVKAGISKFTAKGVQKSKTAMKKKETVVLPIRSEAPLTIPTTPEVLKKSKPKGDSKYLSVAECVAQFSKRTPDRFRVAPAKTKFHAKPAEERPRVTQAQSPNFQPRRMRQRTIMSAAEQEEAMMKSIKPFKAQPVNQHIIESKGDLGVPRVAAKDITVPVEFAFETEKRIGMRPKPTAEAPEQFTAHPIPSTILADGPVGVPAKIQKAATIPKTPRITKKAPRPPTAEPSEEEEKVEPFHAQPIPELGNIFQPVLPHKHTEPEPFKVAAKNPKEKRQAMLESQIKLEASQREFKASGLPSQSPSALPDVPPKPTTEVLPFEMPGEKISNRKRTDFADKKRKALTEALSQAVFHANPCTSTVTLPFEPQPATKPLTEVNAFDMAMDKRAVERRVFDDMLREKERIQMEEETMQEQQKKIQDQKEILELRKSREIKAKPIRHYKKINDAKQLPLTEPQSPAFSKKIRV